MKEQLQRIGVPVPERPHAEYEASDLTLDDPWMESYVTQDARSLLACIVSDYAEDTRKYAITLERLVATLAERVERAERCLECDGRGWNERFGTEPDRDGLQIQCAACSGTGRRQA